MFHQGSLQSGISVAIQEQKLVACLVRDDGAESARWENEWLQSGWLSSLLAQKAVVLRIQAGSTEAGFLSAFCPVSVAPSLVVIQNGQLQEHLTSGVSEDEFVNRVRVVLGADPIPGTAPSRERELALPSSPVPAPASNSGPRPHLPANSSDPSRRPVPSQSSPANAHQSARDALRKKKQEEKDELARIKARIEADKAERKAQAEARKAERERERLGQSASPASAHPLPPTSSRGSQAKQVALNVRLFDGRTVRSTFPRTAKLQNEVRVWIDQEFTSRAEDPNEKQPPYVFKQILAPLPNRELSAGEENETLGDIDLAPSATLVLIPVKGYTEAYSGDAGGIVKNAVGEVTGLVGSAFGLAYSAAGYVGSSLSSIVGYGGANSMEEVQHQRAPGRTLSESEQLDGTGASSIRVRTLADQRTRESSSEQLYNGNQLNFEPRDDNADRR